MPHAPCPMPYSLFPIPDAPCLMPHDRCIKRIVSMQNLHKSQYFVKIATNIYGGGFYICS